MADNGGQYLLLLWAAAAAVAAFTVLFPLLAALMAPFSRRRAPVQPAAGLLDIAIIIPAFKEAGTLPLTLSSISMAIDELRTVHPEATISITVGLDGADPATRAACGGFPVSVVEFTENLGKWNVLRQLAPAANARWVALTDAGTLWPRTLLVSLWAEMQGGRYGGLAPGYVQPSAGFAERSHWAVERGLKLLENHSGGPVSVHGAAVFYRADVLTEAFRELGPGPWFNDDIVLPLIIRASGHRIRYFGATAAVSDAGIGEADREGRRRTRMVEGNLQWISALWLRVARRNPVVALLAARRGLRPFWIYVAAIPLGAALWAGPWPLALLMTCVSGALVLHPRAQAAALASLKAPLQATAQRRGVLWS